MQGLSTTDARARLKIDGRNSISVSSRSSLFSLLLSELLTLINGILFAASLFSFAIHDQLDGIFILCSIILNILFSFFQEYKAEKSLEKLRDYTVTSSRVLRDGQEKAIPTEELVRDDIVVLTEGERVPADGILQNNHHLEVDESILTGESLPVIKDEKDTLFLGTLILKGRGILKVTATGHKTEFGQIARSLSTIEIEETPLQNQLTRLGKYLTVAILLLAALLLPLGIIHHQDPLHFLLIAISIGVAAVPEGLPVVITIALAVGTNRMAERKAIVKKMQAIETLGEVQYLIVDKTGTLTENSMQVKKYWLKRKDQLLPLLLGCALGNTASLVPRAKKGSFDILGDKTEGALLLFATQLYPQIASLIERGVIRDEYVFETTTKTITTIWKNEGKTQAFVRGAPEEVLKKSHLTPKEQETVENEYQTLAKEGLRVIAVAVKTESHRGRLTREHVEDHLTFLGLVGIADPARSGIKETLMKARKAGIKTIMVTGDNELTAISIGQEIGLLSNSTDVLTGGELQKADDTEVLSLLPTTAIVARATPRDKLRIATLLQQQGYIVGVTGDGVNDALALKKADVGVAMGHSGTDVAKEASDIIILDDTFSTLMTAVEEGRAIYENILKSITYLLTSNASELILVIAAVILNLPTILLPTQILWINLITDGLPALSLATDSKATGVLHHPPRNHTTPLIGGRRLLGMILTGSLLAGLLLSLYLFLLPLTRPEVARTILFNALIFSHLALAFIIRGKTMFKRNNLLLFSFVLTLLLQLLITTLPFFQNIFHLVL